MLERQQQRTTEDSVRKKQTKDDRRTSSAGLSLFAALEDVLFQLLGARLVLFVALLAEFADAEEEVVDVLSSVGIRGGSSHGRRLKERKEDAAGRGTVQREPEAEEACKSPTQGVFLRPGPAQPDRSASATRISEASGYSTGR